ncbi:MAG: trypsin-like peptidase domain-containing protein [Leptospira sp.]|nr:trypsin-like peptidase domain-containing protein [Leptospira sp.]
MPAIHRRLQNKLLSSSNNLRFSILLYILFQLTPFSVQGESSDDFEKIRKGVVQIRVYSQGQDPYSPWMSDSIHGSTGTGFIIDGERILTNAHVISNAKYIQVQRHNQTEWFEVSVQFVAHDCDLAVLKAKNPKFFEDSNSFELGPVPELNSPILVIGYPIGGDRVSVSRGIVSRKEQSTYAHSEVDSHLVIQVDAAINPGNSGGPAIQNNKVVGVAFQVASRAENIGYLIPTTVIKYFLNDIKDGKYDGYVELGIRTMNSFNVSLREAKKIPADLDGVFVTNVFQNSSAEGHLLKEDLLLEIDGLKIGRNGTVKYDKDSRVDFVELVDNKHSGKNISMKVFRKGEIKTLNFPAKRMDDFDFMRNRYDGGFDYFTLGGLVFQPASRDLLNAWSKNGETQGGSQFLYRFFYFIEDGLGKDVKRDVVLYRKMAHPINSSADYFLNMVVESVNGIKVRDLNEMKRLCKKKENEFIRIKFRDVDTPLILKRSELEKADRQIKSTYNLGAENEK